MFDKILIANRGEIACRIIRTARRLGVRSVAVYSEADADSRHVRLADEAVPIGPAEARLSYLSAERILEAARGAGAQAVHPGYGFLSENAAFAEACAEAGLVFIGPPAAAIRAMGSKAEAKKLMDQAGVPLVPGYHGDDQDAARLAREAEAIGWPVMIKASAGGGGKGMRAVQEAAAFGAALEAVKREAAASFGSDHVLLEKYLQRPRHIEVQVFGDIRGHVLHLFERDCSVQRRHQKVLEESPAPGLDPAHREALGRAAVAAARAVGYVGAGTVEFIVDQDFAETGAFYFMEMNTRLQVEHPVTEMVTGLDLVEWQLRVAAGEPLPLAQDQVGLRGHALEARIYAEDPERGFLPSTGRLHHLSPPPESAHLRVDTGVEQGDEITPYYDPMIAKLIVWDEDRNRALARMRRALASYRVAGVASNIAFLSRLVACPSFDRADLDTTLIERESAVLFPDPLPTPAEAWMAAALAELLHEEARALPAAEDPGSPWNLRDGWRANAAGSRILHFRRGDEAMAVKVLRLGGGWRLEAAGRSAFGRGRLLGGDDLRLELDGRVHGATLVAAGARRHLFLDGSHHVLDHVDPLHHAGGTSASDGSLLAPMPGKVIALLAAAGAEVDKGAPLLILEAMKMEHTIAAPAAGLVKAFRFAVGDQVEEGRELVDFEAR
ncbi:MAG TPA: acetyl/propionyl/methylcrotonyl-CoA carboxylase subunit alpha [Geothrix sp.]|nr:acetyl/propionyl/methylcrotonyl-CoA carboxylase subunit alpha [Geothrix sp.]